MAESTTSTTSKKTNPGEMQRFLLSGGSAVACDTLVYALLFNFMPPSMAKAISFIAGTVLAFFLNKFWTFKKPKRSHAEVVKFICLYASTLGANIFVNRFVLDHAASMVAAIEPVSAQFAFLSATGTSTVLNYLGQKFWVFKKPDEGSKSAPEAESDS
ncbi:MAG: GtrA family protein [Candidatus Melainabacteria bacterium]|nr:GtrA family protein [Candidatus Melainabacteria bacterium]